MKYSKQDFNKSSFTFNSFSDPPQDPQLNKIYTYQSQQIQQGMRDTCNSQPAVETKSLANNIFHSTRKYKVPLNQTFTLGKQVPSYRQFYSSFRKFTKPYGQLTKFTDSVNKNHCLLRRGQCEIPFALNKPHCHRSYFKLTHSELKHRRKGTKCSKQSQVKEELISLGNQSFHKTTDNQFSIFKKLLSQERNHDKDRAQLNATLDRLLAAESVQNQIAVRPKTAGKYSSG